MRSHNPPTVGAPAVGAPVVGALVAAVLFTPLLVGCTDSQPRPTATAPTASPTSTYIEVDLTHLPATANSWAVLAAAPIDPAPTVMPSGMVVEMRETPGAALFTAPGGEVLALLPQEAYHTVSRYPVIGEQDGWYQVLLVARRGLPSVVGPDQVNGATGWVQAADVIVSRVETTITADLSAGTLTITTDGQVTAVVEAGYGAPETPTPLGRTFVMAVQADSHAAYSRVFVYLGAHSPTLDTFNEGPAPIAVHAYPEHTGPVSNGCLRVSATDLEVVAKVPVGTPVLVVP